MIYTLTLNPAIDYVARCDKLLPGGLNRVAHEAFYIGGKGINVSRVLKALGTKSVALGFVAGFTGDAIVEGLTEEGIENDFVRLGNGFSRINVKIKSSDETELNGKGPKVSAEQVNKLFAKLSKLKKGDILVMSGSVANGMDASSYSDIMKYLADKQIEFLVDASGELLERTLRYRPLLIKPNKQELENFFNVEIDSIEEVREYARKLNEMGAENVLVSLGGDGAVFVNKDSSYYINCPKGKAINTVGAGDSVVAGYLYGMVSGLGLEETLKIAVSAGSTTAFSDDLGKKADIFALVDEIGINRLC